MHPIWYFKDTRTGLVFWIAAQSRCVALNQHISLVGESHRKFIKPIKQKS